MTILNPAGTLGSGSDPQVYPELRVTEIVRGGNTTLAGYDGVQEIFQVGERSSRVTTGDPNELTTQSPVNDVTSSNIVFETGHEEVSLEYSLC